MLTIISYLIFSAKYIWYSDEPVQHTEGLLVPFKSTHVNRMNFLMIFFAFLFNTIQYNTIHCKNISLNILEFFNEG
jgi:hypothetical protein